MIEILDGSGYDEDGELNKNILTKMLDRKDFWIETLHTIYPYGLNERKRKSFNCATIGSLYFPIKRYGQRKCRCRNRSNHRSNSALEFMEFFNNQLSSSLNYSVLEIREYIDNWKKKAFKMIDLLRCDKLPEIKHNSKSEQWYSYVIDIIDTKTFKPRMQIIIRPKNSAKNVFTMMFCNKEMEQINLKIILKFQGSITCLP